MAVNTSADNTIPTFQEMLDRLDALLAWFQADDVDLNEAIGKYEQGMGLVSELQQRVTTAENKIEKVKARFDAAEG